MPNAILASCELSGRGRDSRIEALSNCRSARIPLQEFGRNGYQDGLTLVTFMLGIKKQVRRAGLGLRRDGWGQCLPMANVTVLPDFKTCSMNTSMNSDCAIVVPTHEVATRVIKSVFVSRRPLPLCNIACRRNKPAVIGGWNLTNEQRPTRAEPDKASARTPGFRMQSYRPARTSLPFSRRLQPFLRPKRSTSFRSCLGPACLCRPDREWWAPIVIYERRPGRGRPRSDARHGR